jgi:hypothetical protein
MYGSKKSSYQNIGDQAKIIVRHKKTVDENLQGSRSRNISKIFIESNGVRYLLPFNGVLGARAMARHINEGGAFDDEIATHISETMTQLGQLKSFITYSRKNHLVTEDNKDIVATVVESYQDMRRQLNQMCSRSGYNTFAEGFSPDNSEITEDGLDELRDKFTVKTTEASAMEALPLINKLQFRKKDNQLKELRAFIDSGVLMLEDDMGSDELAYSVKYKDPAQLVKWALEDIHTRVVNNDCVKEFAGQMKTENVFESPLGIIAVQLAKKYIGDLTAMRDEESSDYRSQVRQSPIAQEDNNVGVEISESSTFKSWIKNI